MIDFPLLCFFIGGGVISFVMGFVFGKVFSLNEKPKPCETIEDILKREG